MELGSINSRFQGADLLHGAVHDKNGVAWSDGRGIYLAPVSVYQGEVENQQPTKLGEFDRGVRSIHWSQDIFDGFCYMCVVHDKNISIWKVEGHQPKLTFKQVRKVNIQPIQQGCLWCPERDILCVLTPHQGSLYYSHIENKGSHVLLQLDKDKIRCGCWLPNGSKLVICVGTSLTIYSWSDVDSSITQYSSVSWTIPGLDGPVSSIVPLSDERVVCAAELPLESLCKQNNTFVLPDLLNTQSSLLVPNHLRDSDVIKPRQTTPSVKDLLLNLPQNPQTDLEDSSCLVIVCIHDSSDPEKVSESKVKGILSPDILLYEPDSQLIIVGSNTQTLLQLFELEENKLTKTGEIYLEKDERPKGISCLPGSVGQGHSSILLLVGKKEPGDTAFLSSSNNTTMKSVLKMFSIKPGKGRESSKRLLSHTNSEPLHLNMVSNGDYTKHNGALSVFKNGSHGDLDIGQGSLGSTGQGQNGNTIPGYISDDFANLRKTETKSCVNLSATEGNMNNNQADMIKTEQEIIKCRSVDNVNKDSERHVPVVPVPPRRPVRKKRSARGRNDLHEKVTTQSKETLGKMPMEYSSSPDISPRLNGAHVVPKVTQQNNNLETKQTVSAETRNLKSESVNKAVVDQSVSEETRNLKSGSVNKAVVDQSVSEETRNLKSGSVNKAVVDQFVSEESRNLKNDCVNKTVVDDEEQNEVLNSSNSSGVSSISKHSTNSKCDSSCEESPRVLTLLIGRNDISSKGKIIELGSEDNKKELEIERVDFDFQKRNFEKPNLRSSCFEDDTANVKVRTTKFDTSISDKKEDKSRSSVGESKRSEDISVSREDKNDSSVYQSRSLESLDDIDRQLKQQTVNISHLQEQISELDRRINESTCVLPSRYQPHQNPELVYVSFRCKDGSEIKKKFLLDNGRLKLEPVKHTFCLETVEIFIDDEPCVIGSNIDGYIPMRFEPGTTIHITGKPSLTLV